MSVDRLKTFTTDNRNVGRIKANTMHLGDWVSVRPKQELSICNLQTQFKSTRNTANFLTNGLEWIISFNLLQTNDRCSKEWTHPQMNNRYRSLFNVSLFLTLRRIMYAIIVFIVCWWCLAGIKNRCHLVRLQSVREPVCMNLSTNII